MPKPKILVFQHVPYEPLGTLDPQLRAAGFRIRYVNFGRDPSQRPAPGGYAALIVLGGPMNADQIDSHPNLATEVDVIREAVDAGVSVLGICLGAQLLAKAVGGEVQRNAEREIGWHHVDLTDAGSADPILAPFRRRERVFQWHEDGISLPPDSVRLAGSPASPVQAFRYGENAYGFQFHLETDASLIERWLKVPANRGLLDDELAAGRDHRKIIRRETPSRISALEALSRETFGRWIERFERPRRRTVLPSR